MASEITLLRKVIVYFFTSRGPKPDRFEKHLALPEASAGQPTGQPELILRQVFPECLVPLVFFTELAI